MAKCTSFIAVAIYALVSEATRKVNLVFTSPDRKSHLIFSKYEYVSTSDGYLNTYNLPIIGIMICLNFNKTRHQKGKGRSIVIYNGKQANTERETYKGRYKERQN